MAKYLFIFFILALYGCSSPNDEVAAENWEKCLKEASDFCSKATEDLSIEFYQICINEEVKLCDENN